jgi:hypothetical protein
MVKTTKLQNRTKVLLAGIGLTAVVGTMGSSCGDKFDEAFKDAPRSHHDNSLPMDVIQGADGFSNVGSKCDGYGGRVYMAYHGDVAYASVAVKSYSELKPSDPCRNYDAGSQNSDAGGE